MSVGISYLWGATLHVGLWGAIPQKGFRYVSLCFDLLLGSFVLHLRGELNT